MNTLTLTVGAPANGGSCVARHDGRVVFVRYALPGETVRANVTNERGSYWHADAVEELEAAGTFDDITQLGSGQDDIDRQLHQLSSQSVVDDELAKMKAELGPGGGDAPALEQGEERPAS